MKKKRTELVSVLNRGGSMQGLECDTLGGFNARLEKQRQQPGKSGCLHDPV